MNPIFAAAAEIQEACVEAGFRFCFIGGLAVQRWGQPRLTHDVDLTLLTGFGAERPFVDVLLARFGGRLPDAAQFAMDHRVLLLRAQNGVPLDVSLGAMPFEERTIARSSAFTVDPRLNLTTCSGEDLVVHKVFASREKDWLDVTGIVVRQGLALDRQLIWEELGPLLELRGGDTTEARLRAVFASH